MNGCSAPFSASGALARDSVRNALLFGNVLALAGGRRAKNGLDGEFGRYRSMNKLNVRG